MSVPAATRRRPDDAHLREVFAEPQGRTSVWPLALGVVCAIGAIYHWLQSRGHATPAVFTDELLFSELARSLAAGEGFVVRDQPLFFPAFVPSLLQAPAWLAGSTPLAYALAKALNTVLMCSAALPAYWLARHLVRPAYALIVAAATLAGGGMLYHGYLTSESAAYPVFLLAVAVSVRALAAPSRGRDLLAVAVLFLAVLTRAQFVVLPLVFVVAMLLVGRPLRRHVTALAALGLAAVLGLAAGAGALGFYEGARELDYPLGETLRWTAWTAALLPFGVGLLVVPGAVLGLAHAVRDRRAGERAFGVVTTLLLVLMPLQAGLIASGESHKPFERYVFYLAPLLFLAFFTFAERCVTAKRWQIAGAAGLAGLALVIPFASLALYPFSFDSPTLSAVGTVGRWTSQGDAAALFAAAGVLGGLAAVGLQRRPALAGVLSVALAFSIGLAAYDGDKRMTRRTLDSLVGSKPDWLERTGVAKADLLALPGGSLHSGWVLESWNRNAGRTFHLGDVPHDQLPYTPVGIESDGTVSTVPGDSSPKPLPRDQRRRHAGGARRPPGLTSRRWALAVPDGRGVAPEVVRRRARPRRLDPRRRPLPRLACRDTGRVPRGAQSPDRADGPHCRGGGRPGPAARTPPPGRDDHASRARLRTPAARAFDSCRQGRFRGRGHRSAEACRGPRQPPPFRG